MARVAAGPPRADRESARGDRARTVATWVLVVVATVVVVVSSLTVWVKRQVVSTPRWTDAAGKMLEDTRVRDAVAVYLVNELYNRVDVAGEVEDKLPEQFKPLAPLAAGVLHEFGTRAADAVLAQPETIRLWKHANEVAHSELLALIQGRSDRLVTTNGDVVLDLRPILKRFEETTLGSEVVARLPADAGHITIMRSDQVEAARTGARVLRTISMLVTLALVAFYAGALWLSRNRRKTLLSIGLFLLAAGLLVLVARHLTGDYLISTLTSDRPDLGPAGAAVWAITTELLWFSGLALLGYGIAVVAAAALAGPARLAVAVRRVLAPVLERHPRAAFGAVFALFAFLLLFGPIDWERLIALGAFCASALAGVELLRRQTHREFLSPKGPP
jgi:hypothetical protein